VSNGRRNPDELANHPAAITQRGSPSFMRVCLSCCRYNIGQVAIGIGDLGVAYQAFKIAVSVDSNHVESYSNLGVLELRKGGIDLSRSNFQMAQRLAPYMFEPFFNAGTRTLYVL
jgi:hypothetical protein